MRRTAIYMELTCLCNCVMIHNNWIDRILWKVNLIYSPSQYLMTSKTANGSPMKAMLIWCDATAIWQWRKTHILSINDLLTHVTVSNGKVIIAKSSMINSYYRVFAKAIRILTMGGSHFCYHGGSLAVMSLPSLLTHPTLLS